jgi:hypothetical protein
MGCAVAVPHFAVFPQQGRKSGTVTDAVLLAETGV